MLILEPKTSTKTVPSKGINISSTVKQKKRRSQNKSSINYSKENLPLSNFTAKKSKI